MGSGSDLISAPELGGCTRAFIIDAYSKYIVGWQTATTLRASLAIDALEMALATRRRDPEQPTPQNPRLEDPRRDLQRTPTLSQTRQCCDDPLNLSNICPFVTPTAWPKARSPRWEAKETAICPFVASVGSKGDSYDNALTETTIGLYKTELIRNRGPWRDLDHTTFATLEYIDWFNHRRLHRGITPDTTYTTPAEHETNYHQTNPTTPQIAQTTNPL